MPLTGGLHYALARDLPKSTVGGRHAHPVFQQGRRCPFPNIRDVMFMIAFLARFPDGHPPGDARGGHPRAEVRAQLRRPAERRRARRQMYASSSFPSLLALTIRLARLPRKVPRVPRKTSCCSSTGNADAAPETPLAAGAPVLLPRDVGHRACACWCRVSAVSLVCPQDTRATAVILVGVREGILRAHLQSVNVI